LPARESDALRALRFVRPRTPIEYETNSSGAVHALLIRDKDYKNSKTQGEENRKGKSAVFPTPVDSK
jgi:hypothetical protein